jgi:hypothetical protein
LKTLSRSLLFVAILGAIFSNVIFAWFEQTIAEVKKETKAARKAANN